MIIQKVHAILDSWQIQLIHELERKQQSLFKKMSACELPSAPDLWKEGVE